MSGGSYNYLCWMEANNIYKRIQDIEKMADRLEELGYNQLGEETRVLSRMTIRVEKLFDNKINRLSQLWKAVEWADSGDSGIEEIKKEAEKLL